MKAVLLTSLMFTLALGQKFNNKPCQKSSNQDAYKTFVKRHVLPRSFDRNKWTMNDWKDYLNKTGLCNRPRQTFIVEDNRRQVERICRGSGRNTRLNLCISNSPVQVYHLTIRSKCKFAKPKPVPKHVIVACDRIGNVCRPVHLQGVTDKLPKGKLKRCK